jgi:hypothetical protein
MADINWIAAIVAGVLGFFVGGLWSSPLLFAAAWSKETGMNGPGPGPAPAVRFGLGALLSVIAALLLSHALPGETLGHAVAGGAAVGAGFVATSLGINYLFEGRSFKLWLINAGYHVVQFTVIGLVLGLWR